VGGKEYERNTIFALVVARQNGALAHDMRVLFSRTTAGANVYRIFGLRECERIIMKKIRKNMKNIEEVWKNFKFQKIVPLLLKLIETFIQTFRCHIIFPVYA
jgi:hypothetical protein